MTVYAAHTTNKNTHLLYINRSKIKQQEPHKRAHLSENGGLLGKQKSGEWTESRKGQDRKSNRTRQQNKG